MGIHRVTKTKSRPARRHLTISHHEETLAYDRVLQLPFDLATIYSAAQNFRIDLAKGVHPNLDAWDLYHQEYFQEALELLQEDGCNLFPGDNDEPWIHAAKSSGTIVMPSARCVRLANLFTDIFAKNDITLLGSDFYPDPKKIVTTRQIDRLLTKLHRKYSYH